MSGGGRVTGAVVVAVTLLHATTGVLSAIDGEYDLAKLQILLAVTTAGAGLLLREVVRLRRLAKTPHEVSWGKGFLEGMAAWESLNASILANDMRQDHHQTHGNGPVSTEEREMDHGRRRRRYGRGEGRGMRVSKEQREALRELAEAEPTRGWQVVNGNESTEFRPLWMVTNDAFHNPPNGDDGEPWLAVEVHTGTLSLARHIAATEPAVVLSLLDDLDDAEQRAERAEAELAALRERVRGMADNADRWAAREINGNAFDATVTTADLRHLLDDDTTGAASGEGEK